MAISITMRWAGAPDAASGSRYRVERSLDFETWSELAAAQAATSPYAAPTAVLSGDHSYGDTAINLVSGTPISASGYGLIDDALVQWTGKTTNQLTGVTWHSGYGTYATGTTLYEAHESYVDSTTPTNLAVVYRITHIDPADLEGPAAYSWSYYPSAPASRDHCVVIVAIGTDLGLEVQDGVAVTCQLAADNQFGAGAGAQHLDQATAAAGTQTTDALGLAEFQCWKNSARAGQGGAADAAYTFVLNSGSSAALTVTVTTIPDRDWVLLRDIAD